MRRRGGEGGGGGGMRRREKVVEVVVRERKLTNVLGAGRWGGEVGFWQAAVEGRHGGRQRGQQGAVGLLMWPSPTRVRSLLVSSSTVRRLGRVSEGRGMGDRWVPKVAWRVGGIRHRLVAECPLALELREESRLSERRLALRATLEEMPFSRLCFLESGVEQEMAGVRRRKSGSTRSFLFRRPRWSLARIAEVEAIFGHHGTQDLSDGFGRFGLQTHGAVNGDQVQSRSTERAREEVHSSDVDVDALTEVVEDVPYRGPGPETDGRAGAVGQHHAARNLTSIFPAEQEVAISRLVPDDKEPWDSLRPLLPQ
ncbi:hypothetical protein F7725_004507 [Dissostichus mawsoni]|uniref:Uncharacterized protein n=1 Tax=Dissostichus mawsoni TaxID=36200 RepID=A0A7J5XJL9_DISMA|nr:hypothetical protein F7725_004507 [Dissostichus mawsoni]